MIDLPPSARALLDGLGRRVMVAAPDSRMAAPAGGWTAWYLGRNVVLLARAARTGPSGAIAVVAPATGWGEVVTGATRFDSPEFGSALDEALRTARDSARSEAEDSFPEMPSTRSVASGGDLLRLLRDTGKAIAWLLRRDAPRQPAMRLSGEAERTLRAARIEAALRESSLRLGCLGAGVVLLLVGIVLGTLVSSKLALAIALAPYLVVFWMIRRRLPSPPQTLAERRAGMVLIPAILIVPIAFVGILFLGPNLASITEEQAVWCLGPGAGYVDSAIAVLNIPETWTTENARADANFRSACHTAWAAAHDASVPAGTRLAGPSVPVHGHPSA